MQIETKLDRTKINHLQPADIHLMVRVTAPEVAASSRKPVDVVLVMDVSTSMSEAATNRLDGPTKLELMRTAAARFVQNLEPQDRVGLIAYSNYAETLAPVAELTATHRELLNERISRLRVIGGTNLVGGTLRGLECLAGCPANAGRVRRVILFTDGLPTVGVTKHAEVLAAIVTYRTQKAPITTIGFGATVVANGQGSGGYDPELLVAIARLSGGNPYHAEGEDDILGAFALELGALRSAAATDVRVAITPGSGVRVMKAYNDLHLPTRVERDATVIELGQLYGGESQFVVVKLAVPIRDTAFPRDMTAATVAVSGVRTTYGEAFREEQRVEFRYVKAAEATVDPDPVVEEQRLRLKAARAIKRAFEDAQKGRHAAAADRIRIIRVALARFGSQESQAIVIALQAIEDDVGDPRRFAQRSGHVHAASSSVAVRRTTTSGGTSYVRRDTYTTGMQQQAAHDMGTKSGGQPSTPDPSHSTGSRDS